MTVRAAWLINRGDIAGGQTRSDSRMTPLGTMTPAADPAPPELPATALPLYRVAVPAGASAGTGGIDFPAATTDLRTHVAAVGGIAPATDGDGAYRAQYRDNYTGLQRWSGSSWVGMACELIPWTKASLASGFGHDGNNNGDVRYRVIDLIGTRFVQWRGGMNVSYRGGLPAHDGKFLARPLPATARPRSGLRTVPVACSAGDSSILSLKADFYANGTADLLNDPGDTPPWVSFSGVMYPL